MRSIGWYALVLVLAALSGCAGVSTPASRAREEAQVRATEAAFAKTMADRDSQAFAKYISAEAIFLSGKDATRDKEQIVKQWQGYFKSAQAPFSWQPETVQVLDSGGLAISSGPVFGPDGKRIATFSSIWREEAPGIWRIIFDNGCDVCACAPG
ncbi:MAG: nuclear transport factor 2 family protein [Burkholderiaceae bacterium]|jgi:ketosteroid isomerase-like protein